MRIICLVICCLLLLPLATRGASGPATWPGTQARPTSSAFATANIHITGSDNLAIDPHDTSGPAIRSSTLAVPPSSTLATENIDAIGHFGGPSYAVVVQGSYAYVGVGGELAVMNITDPARPVRTGYVALPSIVRDIAIAGNYAYVADAWAGLRVVDITYPTAPREAGFYDTPGYARGVALSGHYAYIADDDKGLQVIDITNPAAPLGVGSLEGFEMSLKSVAIQGNYLYGATLFNVSARYTSGSLDVVDISNPVAPAFVRSVPMPAPSWDVTIDGHFAYVAWGAGLYNPTEEVGGLQVVDIANPNTPQAMGAYEIRKIARQVTVAGNRAYLTDMGLGLYVLDVATPTAPRKIASYDLPGNDTWNVAVVNSYAYVAAWDRGLRVVNLVARANEAQIGAYDTILGAQDIAIAGNYAYIVDGEAMHTLDISHPAAPVKRGTYNRFSEGPNVVTVAENYAYLGRHGTNSEGKFAGAGLYILDISNPAAPVQVSYSSTPAIIFDLAVVGAYLYVTADDGLRIIDVSNPAAPIVIAFFKTSGWVFGLALAGHYAYLAGEFAEGAGMIVVDITDPLHLSQIAYLQLPLGITQSVNDIAVAGHSAYISGLGRGALEGSGYLAVIDIANPAAPSRVAIHQTLGGRIAVLDNYVYTASDYFFTGEDYYIQSAKGGMVIDVTMPSAPVTVGSYSFSSRDALAVADGNIYVGGDAGLFVLRFTPQELRGRVADALGRPVAGVTLAADAEHTTVTDDAGAYRLTIRPQRTSTVMPALAGFIFEPPLATITLTDSVVRQDFLILPAPLTTTLTPGVAAGLTYTGTHQTATSLRFAANAVSQTTTLILTPTLGPLRDGLAFTGHAFELAASQADRPGPGLVFAEPVSVTISYAGLDVQVVTDERQLTLWWWNGSAWVDAAETCGAPIAYERDPEHNMLRAGICRTGWFALYGPTHRVHLPLMGFATPGQSRSATHR